MISVKAYFGKYVFSLLAEGHANAERNEDGRDLVCCAVATIMTTLANSCTKLEGVKTHYAPKSGYGKVFVMADDEHRDGVEARFQMALDGLSVLAMQYPESIQMG